MQRKIQKLDRGSIRSSPRDGLQIDKQVVWDCSTISLTTWDTYIWSIIYGIWLAWMLAFGQWCNA